MNMKNLINLLNQLYPKDMIRHEAKLDELNMKEIAINPTKVHLRKPEVLKVFEDDFRIMSDPTLHLATVKSETRNWDNSVKMNKKLQKEVAKPNTYLDTDTYTPSYFNNIFGYINRNKQEILKFVKTLKSSDEVYYTQQDALSNETHRYILTKALVKETVKHSIAKYKKMAIA